MDIGDHEQARRCGEASLAIGEQLDDIEVRAGALEILGGIALTLHEYERAKPLMEEAIALTHELGERAVEAVSLQVLAGIEHGLGDDESAERHCLEALAVSRDIGGPVCIAVTLARLGRLVRDQGNDRAAALAYREALTHCANSGDRFSIVQQFAGLGEIASRRGQAEIAAVLLGVIDQIAEEAGATRLPTAGVNYDRATTAAREALGEERFAALRAAGRRLPIDQAVALARSVRIPAALPGVPDPAWLSVSAATTSTGDLAPFGQGTERRDERPLDLAAWLPVSAAAPDLTYREQDVLALLCRRQTDAEIAAQLFVSPRTVSSHVSSILAKLGAANRRDAAAIAARLGLIGS
jgi:DNA-binding CsgD family transcriptional regulator